MFNFFHSKDISENLSEIKHLLKDQFNKPAGMNYEDQMIQHRYVLDNIISEQQSSFDKSILNISTAGIAAIFVFKASLEKSSIELPWAANAAWVCYGSAMMSTLFSFLASMVINTVDRDFAAGEEAYLIDAKKNKFSYKCADLFLCASNKLSLVTFLTGVVCTILFCYNNIKM